MPVILLAVIMTILAVIASLIIFVAWQRVPAMKWFAAAVVLLYAGLIVAAILHMRAARADIAEGMAQIKTGRTTHKRTSGRFTSYYVTLDNIGEVEVSSADYDAMDIGAAFTVSFSPRVRRAWTVQKA